MTNVGAELEKFRRHCAAVIAPDDLVISVDTSVAHLAGALGLPLWVLLPFLPDWRWMLEAADQPLVSDGGLFRQTALGDWDGVIARVGDELKRFVQS